MTIKNVTEQSTKLWDMLLKINLTFVPIIITGLIALNVFLIKGHWEQEKKHAISDMKFAEDDRREIRDAATLSNIHEHLSMISMQLYITPAEVLAELKEHRAEHKRSGG